MSNVGSAEHALKMVTQTLHSNPNFVSSTISLCSQNPDVKLSTCQNTGVVNAVRIGKGGICAVCFIESNLKCKECSVVFYCSKDHQKAHWKIHKKVCNRENEKAKIAADVDHATKTFEMMNNVSNGKSTLNHQPRKVKSNPHASWSTGFKNAKQKYEWFVDSYRMRIDDDCIWGGIMRGLYSNQTPGFAGEFGRTTPTAVICTDFLIFAKLAVLREVVPLLDWSWEAFLDIALNLVAYPFSKNDAKAKYGDENVFLVNSGGRSLRYTAEFVYPCPVNAQKPDPVYNKWIDEISKNANNDVEVIFNNALLLTDDIGESEIWKEFKTKLSRKRGN